MTDEPDKSPPQAPTHILPAVGNSERAPFIYFDAALTFGIHNGAVQIELAAGTIVPDGKGAIRTDALITAHLRCSPAAAMDLRNAIDQVFAMPGMQILTQQSPSGARN